MSADHRTGSHASASHSLPVLAVDRTHTAAPVPDCHRGMPLLGTGEELAKPAEVPLLTGDVGCVFSGCKATVCSCQRAFLSLGEAEQLQVSGPKVKISKDIQLLTEGLWKLRRAVLWQGNTHKSWQKALASLVSREMTTAHFTAIFSSPEYRHPIPCVTWRIKNQRFPGGNEDLSFLPCIILIPLSLRELKYSIRKYFHSSSHRINSRGRFGGPSIHRGWILEKDSARCLGSVLVGVPRCCSLAPHLCVKWIHCWYNNQSNRPMSKNQRAEDGLRMGKLCKSQSQLQPLAWRDGMNGAEFNPVRGPSYTLISFKWAIWFLKSLFV